MAKVYGGFTANFYGKLGNVVGRVRQGRSILSIYQPNVHNPKTAGQQLARGKFSLLTGFLKTISGFLRVSFRDLDGYKTGNSFSSAIGYNFRRDPSVFDGVSSEALELVFSNIQVSQGSIDLPYSPSAIADGTELGLTWSDNTGFGNAEATDVAMVVAYNKDKNVSVFSTNLAARNARSATFNMPTGWTGDSVVVWFAMCRPSTGMCSASAYLGTISL